MQTVAPRDFSRRKHFPGTDSSRFDLAIRSAERVDSLPGPIFVILLAALAAPLAIRDSRVAFTLWMFMLGDWALLALLPRARRSFGPSKPPTLLLAFLRLPPALLPFTGSFVLQLLGTALVIYGFWIEPQRVNLTRVQLTSPKLKAGTRLRLIHLGDLHVERETGRERHVIELVHALAPDLILFSGDVLSLSTVYDKIAWEHARHILSNLSAPLGVYAVPGSPPVDVPDVISQVTDGTPVRWLVDEELLLPAQVRLVGLGCTHRPNADAKRLRAIHPQGTLEFTVLLYHTPDLAPEAVACGIDLQLSGHTHGGQVRLPFLGALYTSSLYGKRFESGQYRIGEMLLYVTRGIGMEGKGAPRVRFLCAPEVILWEIVGP